MAHEWAPPDRMRAHYELFARYVMPRFQNAIERVVRAHRSAVEHRDSYLYEEARAIAAAIRTSGADVPETVLGVRMRDEDR
jgi:limonene 1,2-monooxygenase